MFCSTGPGLGSGATPWQLMFCSTGLGPGSGATPWQLMFCSTGARPGSGATPWQLMFCSTGARPGSGATPWQLLPRLLEHSGRHSRLLCPGRLPFCVSSHLYTYCTGEEMSI